MTSAQDRWNDLEWVSAVALRYHKRRRSFLEGLSKSESVISLVSGGTAFVTLTAGYHYAAAVSSLIATLIAAANLSFGLAERARLHGDLYRRWSALRANLKAIRDDDDQQITSLDVERENINGDMPGQLEVLSVVCENEEREIRRASLMCKVHWWQRLMASWVSLPPFSFPEYDPKSAKKSLWSRLVRGSS